MHNRMVVHARYEQIHTHHTQHFKGINVYSITDSYETKLHYGQQPRAVQSPAGRGDQLGGAKADNKIGGILTESSASAKSAAAPVVLGRREKPKSRRGE
ncbi:hypothetical protein HPP92_016225 [Vanilla planifolia]|uniref:Uncharacterized protein n=1 Tax=Vanilla planifolia TaxID=51239 RepID=A0A835QFQ2_VANPL|nr:hypothetical protein HPP92_016830 [Vanilla planifolia]KAG0471679.1 hypothetical protein HPP92_016225 [Vanilla planifolia]